MPRPIAPPYRVRDRGRGRVGRLASRTPRAREIQGDTGRYAEIRGDMAPRGHWTLRAREIQGDTGRYREIQGDVRRYGEI